MGLYEDTAVARAVAPPHHGLDCPGYKDAEVLVQQIQSLYAGIAKLPSLSPSPDVNYLFSSLVYLCRQPIPIDVATISPRLQLMRTHLIKLCGQAEGLLERHFSDLLASCQGKPLDHVTLFPYYDNYLKLGRLEYELLISQLERIEREAKCAKLQMPRKYAARPKSIAFLGSGPLPLTSIVLAKNHFPTTRFHNYDIDPEANSMAVKLVRQDCDLCQRMDFHTADVMELTRSQLGEHDVIYLAALVGMDGAEKERLVRRLAKTMNSEALLMLRSAHGARAFLYPVVEAAMLNRAGFEVLSVFHPEDEVINSVVIARKICLDL